MDALAAAAHERGLKVHVDGARIFNAAVALGVRAGGAGAQRRHADVLSVQGPVGAGRLGAGRLGRARSAKRAAIRKMVGGGMRQAGVLAAAGLVALRDGVDRLADDHRRARRLAEGLARIPGLTIDLATVQTNIVRFDVGGLGHTAGSFAEGAAAARRETFRVAPASGVRMVVHRHIDDAAIDTALAAASGLAARS